MVKLDRRSIRRIIVFREDAIGDMVIAIPAIKALYDHFDQPEITVVVSNYSNNGDLIQHLPFIHRIVLSPVIQTFKDMWAFSRVLKSKKFDLSVHFSARTGTAWASYFSIPNNVGDRAILGLLPVFWRLGTFHPPHDMMSHQMQRNFILLRKLGIDPIVANTTSLFIDVHPNDTDRITTLLSEHKVVTENPMVGIHLGASGGKPVLPEKYVEYVHAMAQQRPDIQWILTGASTEEKAFRDRFLALCQVPVVDLVGKTTVREMIALVDRLSLIVGVDTGPAHIAAARQVPHLLLSTTKRILPFKWGPWLSPHWVVRSNDNCELICHARQCPEWICSNDVSIVEMVTGSLALLSSGGWKTFQDQQREWLKACLPILIISDSKAKKMADLITNRLKSWGLKVTQKSLNDPDIYAHCTHRDIRIIHNLTGKKKYYFWIMGQLLNTTLSHPPLVIHHAPPLESIDRLVHYYHHHFSKRVL